MLSHLRTWFLQLRDFARRGRAWFQTMAAASELDPFPLRQTLKGYHKEFLKADFRSGLDGALLAIPQGMAFAVVAGLPLAYGITCSAVACSRSTACGRPAEPWTVAVVRASSCPATVPLSTSRAVS